jgi:hypothetical protein
MSICFQNKTKSAPRSLDCTKEIFDIDKEMTEILGYLTGTKVMEPQDIVDNTGRLHHLAKKRQALVAVILLFSEWR